MRFGFFKASLLQLDSKLFRAYTLDIIKFNDVTSYTDFRASEEFLLDSLLNFFKQSIEESDSIVSMRKCPYSPFQKTFRVVTFQRN